MILYTISSNGNGFRPWFCVPTDTSIIVELPKGDKQPNFATPTIITKEKKGCRSGRTLRVYVVTYDRQIHERALVT